MGYHPLWKKKFVKAVTTTLPLLFSKIKPTVYDGNTQKYIDSSQKSPNLLVIFSTHDPLTLSDVPNQNIIYLKKNKTTNTVVAENRERRSFGANITDLLADSFFIDDGLVGDFAKEKILETIKWLQNDKRSKGKKDYIRDVIKLIDEPVVQRKLSDMYDEIFYGRPWFTICGRANTIFREFKSEIKARLMLYLNPKWLKIKNARKEHLDRLIDLIFKRIDKIDCLLGKTWFDFYINDNIETLLVGNVKEIYELSRNLNLQINRNPYFLKYVNYVFNYDWFINKVKSRYCGYDLARNLDTTTCTYCNRNYTNTVISKNGIKITRPQFDHYYDKTRHPFLTLSFYNLIPSCSICNTNVKHGIEFKPNMHAHPYIDNSIDEFTFSYEYSKGPVSQAWVKG